MGGKTSGKAVTASTTGLIRDRVWASHQAKGVPSTSNSKVVQAATRKVSHSGVRSGIQGLTE